MKTQKLIYAFALFLLVFFILFSLVSAEEIRDSKDYSCSDIELVCETNIGFTCDKTSCETNSELGRVEGERQGANVVCGFENLDKFQNIHGKLRFDFNTENINLPLTRDLSSFRLNGIMAFNSWIYFRNYQPTYCTQEEINNFCNIYKKTHQTNICGMYECNYHTKFKSVSGSYEQYFDFENGYEDYWLQSTFDNIDEKYNDKIKIPALRFKFDFQNCNPWPDEICYNSADDDHDKTRINEFDKNAETGIDCDDKDCEHKQCNTDNNNKKFCIETGLSCDKPDEKWECKKNTKPEVKSASINPNPAYTEDDLNITAEILDIDCWDNELTAEFKIQTTNVDGEPMLPVTQTKSCVKNKTTNSCIVSIIIPNQQTIVGQKISINITPKDSTESGDSYLLNIEILNRAPSLTTELVPDYYEIYNESDWVSYDMIFPMFPECHFNVSDPDKEDILININYTIEVFTTKKWNSPYYNSNATWKIIEQKQTSCFVDDPECFVSVPETDIFPGNIVRCTATPIDFAGATGSESSDSVNTPYFDLYFEKTETGLTQVLQTNEFDDIPLINKKEAMARLKIKIYSDLIDWAKQVPVYLKSEPDKKIVYSKTVYADVKNYPDLKTLAEIYDTFSIKMLNELKKGKDTANFFDIEPYSSSKNYNLEVNAEINSAKTFKESGFQGYENTYEFEKQVLSNNKKMYVFFVPVEVHAWKTGYNRREYDAWVDIYINDIKDMYPIAEENLIINISHTPYRPYKITPWTLVLSNLNDMAKDYKKANPVSDENSRIVKFVGVVPEMKYLGWTNPSSYPDATIVKGPSEGTVAHEIGHLPPFNLNAGTFEAEDYDAYPPSGSLSNKGWRVRNQVDGGIINLNTTIYNAGTDDPDVTDIIYGRTIEGGKYHCFMGSTEPAWPSKKAYIKILKALTNWEPKPIE